MGSSSAGNIVERLASRATWISRAFVVAWALLAALVIPTARVWPSTPTVTFALGVLALWTFGVIAVVSVAAAVLSYARRREVTATPTAIALGPIVRSYGALLLLAAVVFFALRPGTVDGWLPAHFTHRPPIVLCARLGLASAAAFMLVGAWAWGLRRDYARFPVWLLGVHYVVLRVGAHSAVWRVFDPNWWLLDLLGLLVLGGSAWALLPTSPGSRLRRATAGGLVVMAVSAAAVLVGYGSWAAPRAELREQYPGPADLMRFVQRSFDLDGDGFAAAFGGLDCDDADPAVSPGSLEIIGNGIDDNCFGGDLARPVALPGPPKRGEGRARSVVLITVDALRADHVEAETMPNLHAFASEAAWFERAYSQASFTDNSIRSLMTGRHPMDFDGVSQFFGQEPTIAELLTLAGYETHAIKVNVLLTPYAFMGFGTVDDEISARNEAHDAVTSEQVADKAIAAFDRLDAGERPFLLWVHLFDPHADYMPHPEAPFGGDSDAELYRQEVWFTDQHLGRVLAHLKARGFLARGLVAVTSDHGEILGEHGVSGHANWLYEAAVRVPLVLAGVDVVPGPQTTRVRLIDLYSTVLVLAAGIVADSDGRPLTELWTGTQVADRDVFARTTYGGEYTRAGWVGDDKLIQDLLHGTEALYDLAADDAEADNLIDDDPERTGRLRDAIGRQWDRSVNDLVLQRKRALLPSRQVDPEVWAKFELAVARRDCGRGQAVACARLRQLEGG
jgi:arylsulfatase A-like enzyme